MNLSKFILPLVLTPFLSSCELTNFFEDDTETQVAKTPEEISKENIANGKIFAQGLANEIDIIPSIQEQFTEFGETLNSDFENIEHHTDSVTAHSLVLTQVFALSSAYLEDATKDAEPFDGINYPFPATADIQTYNSPEYLDGIDCDLSFVESPDTFGYFPEVCTNQFANTYTGQFTFDSSTNTITLNAVTTIAFWDSYTGQVNYNTVTTKFDFILPSLNLDENAEFNIEIANFNSIDSFISEFNVDSIYFNIGFHSQFANTSVEELANEESLEFESISLGVDNFSLQIKDITLFGSGNLSMVIQNQDGESVPTSMVYDILGGITNSQNKTIEAQMVFTLEMDGANLSEGSIDSLLMSLQFTVQMYTQRNDPDVFLQTTISLRLNNLESEQLPDIYVTLENIIKVGETEYQHKVDVSFVEGEFGLILEATKNGVTSQFILASNISSSPGENGLSYLGQIVTNNELVGLVYLDLENTVIKVIFNDNETVELFSPDDLENLMEQNESPNLIDQQ